MKTEIHSYVSAADWDPNLDPWYFLAHSFYLFICGKQKLCCFFVASHFVLLPDCYPPKVQPSGRPNNEWFNLAFHQWTTWERTGDQSVTLSSEIKQ